MLRCSAVTHHLPMCQLCLTCAPRHPPPTPSGIGARHLNPQVSFILPRFGSPLVTDERKRNDRQMNKVTDSVGDPETERGGKSKLFTLKCFVALLSVCITFAVKWPSWWLLMATQAGSPRFCFSWEGLGSACSLKFKI